MFFCNKISLYFKAGVGQRNEYCEYQSLSRVSKQETAESMCLCLRNGTGATSFCCKIFCRKVFRRRIFYRTEFSLYGVFSPCGIFAIKIPAIQIVANLSRFIGSFSLVLVFSIPRRVVRLLRSITYFQVDPLSTNKVLLP